MKLVKAHTGATPRGLNHAQRVALNLLTGWTCPGFCAGEGEWLKHCDEVCGPGRWRSTPKTLKG